MMTTNKLTKTFASGSLAIGVLAGAVLTATSASAASMMLTWAAWTGGTPLAIDDKIVTYVSGDIGADPLDDVELMGMGDHHYFLYDATTMDSPDANMGPGGSFTYTIEVNPLISNKHIIGVDLDSDVSSNYGTLTETFLEVPNVLISVNGSAVPLTGFEPIAPKQLLTVTNTLVNADPNNEGLFQFQNSFHQDVPEPGTVLGLLAVGGLGLVSRFKKQK
jgi:hypothetical protein